MSLEQDQLDGLLVVDKPGRVAPSTERLWTSHDVVARIRRLSGQRRIGHTGTLDPMASGVLVLCLGSATRLVEYYQGEDKRYNAEIVLGYATDTYDSEGAVTATAPIPALTQQAVEAALAAFCGEIRQTPPAYSAIKVDGKALYARARRGESVTPDARSVTFHRIDLIEWRAPDRLLLAIHCSAGAYIRSLAYDLGRSLGTLATLDVLRREAAGEFTLEESHSLAAIETAAVHNRLSGLLREPGAGLPLPQVLLSPELRRRFGHGQHVPLAQTLCAAKRPLVQVYDEAGELAGIIRCVETAEDSADPAATALWKAEKWLT